MIPDAAQSTLCMHLPPIPHLPQQPPYEGNQLRVHHPSPSPLLPHLPQQPPNEGHQLRVHHPRVVPVLGGELLAPVHHAENHADGGKALTPAGGAVRRGEGGSFSACRPEGWGGNSGYFEVREEGIISARRLERSSIGWFCSQGDEK